MAYRHHTSEYVLLLSWISYIDRLTLNFLRDRCKYCLDEETLSPYCGGGFNEARNVVCHPHSKKSIRIEGQSFWETFDEVADARGK